MYGRDYVYANTRVAGTIVRLKKDNVPVYVYNVDNRGSCKVIDIEDMIRNRDDFDEAGKGFFVGLDDLNLAPVPLGYVNTGGQALYLQRIPIRRGPGNQGLTQDNCATTGEMLWRFPNKCLRQCIMGKYPTFEKAVEESKATAKGGKKKLIAFHRSWAVRDDVLFYKNNMEVGVIDKGKPVLQQAYSYLQESLSELV